MSFFFQAEDGIRDYKVTGVQTCALPIFRRPRPPRPARATLPTEPALAGRPCAPTAALTRLASHGPVQKPAHVALLAAPHGGAGTTGTVGVVVAEDVQGPVHREADELLPHVAPCTLHVARSAASWNVRR